MLKTLSQYEDLLIASVTDHESTAETLPIPQSEPTLLREKPSS